MRKGYKETLPKGTHDTEGAPIWGAPAPTPEKKKSQREEARLEVFKRNSEKEVPWQASFRMAGCGPGGYTWMNFEGLYKGFRKRLLEDPAFEHQVLEMILERIMSELYVPLNHRPQAGLKLSIVRKPVAKGE